MDNNIGKKLDGRYELIELIGVGGMADIYRARDIQENRIVAVKILKTEFAGSDEFLRRFRNESKAIALLSHPNIVKIYDVGFTEKVQFIVMEYVDGITLTDYIEQQGVLKWRDAVHFTVQILRALQHAHDRGIVHRDVKSSNIMLLRDGTIKVMDFGIARFNRENNKTMSEKTIGSVHYISPEQARGDITDERSDIYSVGVMLYEMLTGKKPYDGDTPVAIALKHMQSTPQKPTELNSTIPEGLEQIVLRAMQKEPTARYQTAGEMITDLEEFKKNPGIVFDYKYNSTDGTAKFADKNPAVEQEKLRRKNMVVEDYDEDDDDDDYDDDDEVEERRSPLIPILFAVGAAFVIATVFLVLMLLANGFGGKESSDTSNQSNSGAISVTDGGEFNMPNLVGMTWDEALAQYGDGKLMKLVPTQEYNEAKEGFIFEQEFVEGRRVKQGVTVNVKVSMGIKQVEIQDVTGRTADNAEKTLKRDGFKVSKTFADSEDIAEGHVISTTPAAHEFLPQGSTVVIVVSNGAADKMFYMPNLVGMPMEDATKRCDEYKLIPKLQPKDSDEEKGKIIEQSIKEGEKVAPNTEVILTYSTGEIPEKECEINITLPTNITGEFVFKYFVDGELKEETNPIDVSLSGSKTINYTVKGKPGEEKFFAIKVVSTKTGRDGLYIEMKIKFNEGDDMAEKTELSRNSAVFRQLLKEETSSSSSDDSSSDSETSLV
ncbi:MAG: Stk1 family PASTA domain-containing Ser/Thr kinase [Oscillospiraceae bacterium]